MGKLHDEIETHGRKATKDLRAAGEEQRRVDMAADLMALTGDAVSYLHAGFCLAALPHRKPRDDLKPWDRHNGGFHLRVRPGEVFDLAAGDWRQVGIPYGPKARLIMLYMQSEAVRTRDRTVSMGESMSNWMHGMGLAVTGGIKGTIRPVREQATRVSRCTFTMAWPAADGGMWLEDHRLVDGASLWFPGDPQQGVLWPSYIELSRAFFESLLNRAVPLDEYAIRHLKGSSLADNRRSVPAGPPDSRGAAAWPFHSSRMPPYETSTCPSIACSERHTATAIAGFELYPPTPIGAGVASGLGSGRARMRFWTAACSQKRTFSAPPREVRS